MCSKTLNHSDSLRGECADQCVSPCCGFECEEVEEMRRKKILKRGHKVHSHLLDTPFNYEEITK